MAEQNNTSALAPRLAEEIRDKLIAGELRPGQRLSEAALSTGLDVSRNSLREAFRLLTKEGLLRHEPNRGVFVATPSMGSIIDIYRVRRMIECQAIAKAYPKHPAVARMRSAVEHAKVARSRKDWRTVGSENMVFHAAIVDLADSQRLNTFYAQIAAELRLSFGLLDDPELLHAPYVDLNAAILEKLEAGMTAEAAADLEAYLMQSERTVLAAFSRIVTDNASGR
ncbi:DNA-binding GntR family transcriptional regulator [Sinorhizobium fredii]|uniref:Transcriptional regulator protein n=1 Tax=Sinorhizobium fredii (strain USDA 257) TaxID=1185652 RepID=I3X5E2_SINF2|nr:MULTISPECIES: GntR family transcriptional regulator [Sinorhizobium]AFL51098.1 transcriptional regulator protein [Sinorhizobium fredii USDA 257]PDT81206.1 GntR family transcriptional regulator [Sinorhizobium sp. BJ1]